MPDRKTHYNLSFVMCRDLGLNVAAAARVAWACQMVDVCTPEWLDAHYPGLLLLPTQCISFGGIGEGGVSRSAALDPRVWIWARFHFPCGHLFAVERKMVLDRLARAFRSALDAGRDIEAGILLHVLQDELTAHQFFRGCHSEANRKRPARARETLAALLTRWFAPPIGHAEYGGAIDDVDCPAWVAPNGTCVDNQNLWACMIAAIGAPFNAQMTESQMWISPALRPDVEARAKIPDWQQDAFDAREFLRAAASLHLPLEV